MANSIDLKGRVAAVTGGAQGIGKAVTERFLASGAKVAIWDRDKALAEKTAAALGKDVTAIAVDVTDFADVEKARDATLKAFGRIDILVNNAGIAGAIATTWETTVEDWRNVMRINLDGPFLCCKAVVPDDDPPELRTHRQHRLHRRQGRQSQCGSLLRVKGGRNRADEVAGQGGRHA